MERISFVDNFSLGSWLGKGHGGGGVRYITAGGMAEARAWWREPALRK